MPAECPRHAGQPAFVSCARCGRPACAYCLPEGGEVCAECHALDEGSAAIPWERTDLPLLRRLGRTTGAALASPTATFSAMPETSPGRALVFAALMHLGAALLAAALLLPVASLDAAGWSTPLSGGEGGLFVAFLVYACAAPPLSAAGGVATSLLLASLFFVAARGAGGRGSFAAGLRATSYAQVFVLVWPFAWVAGLLPGLGTVVLVLVFLAQHVYLAVALTAVARGSHALHGGRAAVAGCFPSGAVVLLVLATVLGTWAIGEATAPSRAPDSYQGPVSY